jgi:chaperonin GroES
MKDTQPNQPHQGKKMKLEPLHDRVIIRRAEKATQSEGGILLPDDAAEAPERGEVLAVGAGAVVDGRLREMTLAKGDKVLFGKYAGTTVKVEGHELLIMREEDVLAVER